MKKVFIALIIWFLAVIPAQAQCINCIYLPLIQGFNPCAESNMSDWKIIIPESTINKVLNPSAEIAGNFVADGGATVTRETTYQHYGLYSYQVQTAGNNEGIELTLDTLNNAIHYVTVRVRGTLPATWDWSLDNITYTPPVLLEQIDSDWSLYGMQFSAARANGSTTLYIDQNGAGIGIFYLDGIQVEEKEYWTTYCDGTQEGCEPNGTLHASTSQRSADSRAGGRLQDLEDDYYLNIGGMSGTGTAPQSLSIDEYAILPGGELNNIKIDSRVFSLVGFISGTNPADFHSKKQTLSDALQPDAYPEDVDGAQPVRLQYHGAVVHKQIAVHYGGGLEGDLSATEPCAWERVAVRFEAPNPYWQEIGESIALLDTNDSTTFRVVTARLRDIGQWDDLGPPDVAGTYTTVSAIIEDDTYIYFGGNFVNFDNIDDADYIVRWHKANQTWSALGTGMNNNVNALTLLSNGNLIAAGAFTTAGGGGANYIAEWDGAAWNALGVGLDDSVSSLAVGLDGTLYAVGSFLNAGGGGANRVAEWDGAAWSALGVGLNGAGNKSVVNPSTGILYVVGSFSTAGGSSANNVASWNGTSWSALGSGLNAQATKVDIAPDGTLIVVGSFTIAGGISLADHVARWNGYSWAHLDVNLPGVPGFFAAYVSKITDPVIERNYDLYLGFNTAGIGVFAGLITVDNEGSGSAYPKIIFTRSGGTSATIETLRNERTGDELLFDYSLLDGETLTIDLSPTKKSIASSQFIGPRLDAVLPNSNFGTWNLLAGNNNVTSFVNEAGDPTIIAYMLWKDSYKSQD